MTNENPIPLPRSAHSPLPCPSCGGRPEALWSVWKDDKKTRWRVCCDCGARGQVQDRIEEAIEAWNRIVSSVNAHASLVERVKELEEALRGILDLDVVEKDLGDSRDPRTVIARAAIAAPRETTKES